MEPKEFKISETHQFNRVDESRDKAESRPIPHPSGELDEPPEKLTLDHRVQLVVAVMNLAAVAMTRDDIVMNMSEVFAQAAALAEGRPVPPLKGKQ